MRAFIFVLLICITLFIIWRILFDADAKKHGVKPQYGDHLYLWFIPCLGISILIAGLSLGQSAEVVKVTYHQETNTYSKESHKYVFFYSYEDEYYQTRLVPLKLFSGKYIHNAGAFDLAVVNMPYGNVSAANYSSFPIKRHSVHKVSRLPKYYFEIPDQTVIRSHSAKAVGTVVPCLVIPGMSY